MEFTRHKGTEGLTDGRTDRRAGRRFAFSEEPFKLRACARTKGGGWGMGGMDRKGERGR